jgi:hypothetical protein
VKLREIESWGVKLRESEVQGGYFKTDGSSVGSCEVSPNINDPKYKTLKNVTS